MAYHSSNCSIVYQNFLVILPLPYFSAFCLTKQIGSYCFVFQRIPMVHVKIHRLDKKHKMIVYDPHGKSWPVELHARPKRGTDLSSGWHNVCNANNLQEGDACIFEFISADAIRLHIFRSGKVKEQQNSDSKPCITVPLP